jgi:hypothetical protein
MTLPLWADGVPDFQSEGRPGACSGESGGVDWATIAGCPLFGAADLVRSKNAERPKQGEAEAVAQGAALPGVEL